MTLPTPERRAELRADIAREREYATRNVITQGPWIRLTPDEADYFLDATEPVADAEVARVVAELRADADAIHDNSFHRQCDKGSYLLAASLVARLARELAEARATTTQGAGPDISAIKVMMWAQRLKAELNAVAAALLTAQADVAHLHTAAKRSYEKAILPKEPTP